MKNNGKRTLSLLLTFLLCLTLMPVGAVADAESAVEETAEEELTAVEKSTETEETVETGETAGVELAAVEEISETAEIALYSENNGTALLSSSGTSGDVAINETNFPDEIFRSYVSSNCDTDGNGTLSAEEIAAVTYIGVFYNIMIFPT